MMTKFCRFCGQTKTLSDFRKNSAFSGGIDSRCVDCLKPIWKAKRDKRKIKSQQYDHVRRTSPEGRERLKLYWRKKRKENPSYRVANNFSRHIRKSLKFSKGHRSWEKLVNYSVADLKSHLESKFLAGMTWENYGEWHIDHIRPICSFDITSKESPDFSRCWSLDNLQPLWAKDNQSKSGQWLA